MWVGSVNTDRESFQDFMDELRADIKKILQRLPPSPTGSDSPRKLNDLGHRISDQINAPAIAQGLTAALREEAEGKLAYEIQELCFDYIKRKYQPPLDVDERIKTCAYENGISTHDVLEVVAILLRDELLPWARPGKCARSREALKDD